MNNIPVRIAKNPDIKGGTPPIGKSLHDRWILVFTLDSGFNAGFWLYCWILALMLDSGFNAGLCSNAC